MELPPLKTPEFVTFPPTLDPKFGETDTSEVDSDDKWLEAAVKVVNDPAESRQNRLEELKKELKVRGIVLHPGDQNQLTAFLRAGQGHVSRALNVISIFLQYQQFDKKGKHAIISFISLDEIQRD